MALGGTYLDHYKDMFKGMLMHEAQQQGSRLEQAVMVEMLEGNKTYFDKIGAVSGTLKSTRNADRIFADQVFERRQITETFVEFSTLIDVEDLIKHASNPKSELIRAAVFALGRRKDQVIIDAISGNAVVTTDGSAANQALTLSVAVNDHSFDSGSGDVGLTAGKLKKALTLLKENYGDAGANRIICIAPARQLMNLTQDTQIVSGDYRTSRPLEGPGVVDNLSGFLGIDFIAYEGTGVDGSSDEKAFLITDDAVKMGIFAPLNVEITKNTNKQGSPDQIAVWEAVGATRMYEEKVVAIACDPLA